MPNFHSLRIFERPDFRLIVNIPKNYSAEDLRSPDEPEQEIPEPPADSSD